ncbi:MAG: hypothetical protein EXR66_09535 [Dehalococcoidia bacterium]|nr:hypothetical protein [Dehalococcoidia bacterium]
MSTIRPDTESRAIACLAIPSLAFQCELVARPGLVGSPVALSDEVRSRVVNVSGEARLRGIRAGMTHSVTRSSCAPPSAS